MVLATLTLLTSTGCVQRRLTIVSDPPGALVKVDDYEIGTTPVSTSFVYYGTRKIQLIKDGYETLTLLQPVPTPWYQYPVIEFFSDNLALREIRDSRVLRYQLQPQIATANEDLLRRADNLRQSGRLGPGVVPAGNLQPVPETLPAPQGLPPAGALPPPPTVIPPGTIVPPGMSAPPPGAFAPPPPAGAPLTPGVPPPGLAPRGSNLPF